MTTFSQDELHETGDICKLGDMTGPRRRKNTATPGTVVAYLRVSKDDRQDDQDTSPVSLDAQRATITAEAARRGWTVVDWFEDPGISGGKGIEQRPGLAAAVEAVERGEAAGLVAAKLDRLSRSVLDTATLMERASRNDWQIITCDLAIDTSTPAGEATANMMAVFAQLERRLISQRTREALAVKKAQGVRLGRPCVTPAGVKARVVSEREAGSTLQDIADGLNGDGTPTARGGLVWRPSTVRAVLMSHAADALALAARSR